MRKLGEELQDVLRELQYDYFLDDWIELVQEDVMKLPKSEKCASIDTAVKMAKLVGRPVVVQLPDGSVHRVHPSGKDENLTAMLEEINRATKENVSPRK